MSGKFALMARMLAVLRTETNDRIVIVSNYTQTLDLFSNLCRERQVCLLTIWVHLQTSLRPPAFLLHPVSCVAKICIVAQKHDVAGPAMFTKPMNVLQAKAG